MLDHRRGGSGAACVLCCVQLAGGLWAMHSNDVISQ